MREIVSRPEGREFETLEPMMRITLNVLPRAVFGAQGTAFDELPQLVPPKVPLLEPTATTLPWAIQRLRRHPRLLARLTAEADARGSGLRQATPWEVQRARPVITTPARVARQRIKVGERASRRHSRGVATAPARGGRGVVYRRDAAGRPVTRRDAERFSA
jgi:hypothetical protein